MSATDLGLRRFETRSLTSRARAMLLESIGQGAFAEGRLPREEKLASQTDLSSLPRASWR